MNNFVFDEQRHVYTLDGVALPSVTQVLAPLHDFSMVPRGVLERARLFGTAVHRTVELFLAGNLEAEGLDPALQGCLDGFCRFLDDHAEFAQSSPIVERIGYHPRLLYAGTPDLEYAFAVIDIKSRPVNMLADPLQLSAYDNFKKGDRDRYVLELKQDGTYQLTNVCRTRAERREHWSKFRYLLEYHNMGEEIKRWK